MRKTVALVLAGGINLDFSVLTHNRAKSALPFAGHFRLVDFSLTNLSRSGINHVGMMIQYLPGSLIEHIGIGQAWDFDSTNRRIKLMPPFVGMGKTEWFRGSADAIYQNLNFIEDTGAEHVLVVCADHVYCMDFRALVAFHRYRNADVSVVTTRRPAHTEPQHYGYVTADENGRVTDFVEKPETPPHDLVSTGTYLFRAEALVERLEEMQSSSTTHHLPTEVVEPLVHDGRVFAYDFEQDWNYLPNLSAYVAFHRKMLRGESTIDIDGEIIMTDMRDRELGSRPASYFGPLSHVEDSFISPDCSIEGTVLRSVISPGVKVAPKAVVRDSILFHDCVVEEGAQLDWVVSDKDAKIGPYCRVGGEMEVEDDWPDQSKLTVLGKGAKIRQGVNVPQGFEIPIRQVVLQNWMDEQMENLKENKK
jgi:glucose-1-phosphate adenylyltransferase